MRALMRKDVALLAAGIAVVLIAGFAVWWVYLHCVYPGAVGPA
jgi:hypothetical protein